MANTTNTERYTYYKKKHFRFSVKRVVDAYRAAGLLKLLVASSGKNRGAVPFFMVVPMMERMVHDLLYIE